MEGIIVREADHKHIFNSNYTPTTKLLVKQMLNFFKNNVQLDPTAQECCQDIDDSFQKQRNENDVIGLN
jgi:hypothetical protein